MKKMQVGAWVKAQRLAQKRSVADLSSAAKISRTAWYDLEHDKHPPGIETQAGVAAALGVRVDWYDRILRGEEPLPALVSTPTDEELSPSQLARVEAVSSTMKALDRRVENLEKALAAVEARLDTKGGQSLPSGT